MLCYVAVTRINANEVPVLERAVRNVLDAYVQSSEGQDRVYVQACTEGLQGKPVGDVITFLTNHGYPVEVFGVTPQGQPNLRNPFLACEVTGRFYPASQLVNVAGTRRGTTIRVSPDHFRANYYNCAGCRRGTPNTERNNGPDSHVLCNLCFRERCRTCPECERVVWEHQMEYWDEDDYDDDEDSNHDEMICRNCVYSSRGDCFEGQEKSFRRANTFGSSRRYGIELETNRGSASDQFAFEAKEDGSIAGWEFVSHVLRGDEGLAEIQNFMASGHNIRVGRNCGMHMHFSVRDLDSAEKYAVFMAFVTTQDWWHRQVESHRDDNTYCHRLDARRLMADVKTAVAGGQEFDRYCNYHDRYYWMNISAFHKHGTFENRLHHATWDFAVVKRWIILNLRFVRAARELRVEPNDTVDSFKAKAERCIAFALQHFGESLQGVEPLQLATT